MDSKASFSFGYGAEAFLPNGLLSFSMKRMLPVAPGLTTRNQAILGAPGIATRNKNATNGAPGIATNGANTLLVDTFIQHSIEYLLAPETSTSLGS